MKVQYLSDLRFLSTDGRSRLAAFLETFDAAEYTLFQWNDALCLNFFQQLRREVQARRRRDTCICPAGRYYTDGKQ